MRVDHTKVSLVIRCPKCKKERIRFLSARNDRKIPLKSISQSYCRHCSPGDCPDMLIVAVDIETYGIKEHI